MHSKPDPKQLKTKPSNPPSTEKQSAAWRKNPGPRDAKRCTRSKDCGTHQLRVARHRENETRAVCKEPKFREMSLSITLSV